MDIEVRSSANFELHITSCFSEEDRLFHISTLFLICKPIMFYFNNISHPLHNIEGWSLPRCLMIYIAWSKMNDSLYIIIILIPTQNGLSKFMVDTFNTFPCSSKHSHKKMRGNYTMIFLEKNMGLVTKFGNWKSTI